MRKYNGAETLVLVIFLSCVCATYDVHINLSTVFHMLTGQNYA